MNKTFIVTGASASGKSTLINAAINIGYNYLPTHMTRKIRPGEKNGESAIFLTNEKFIENFKNGMYLEPSLDFANLKSLNVYYGTPKSWLELLKLENYCSSPVSIKIAKYIYNKTKALWIHLYCDDLDRYYRLISRGISKEEVEKRMVSGDSLYIPENAISLNTSIMCPEEIIKKIRRIER